MSKSAEGVVENAIRFSGIVRSRLIRIILTNYAEEPISNAKCKVTFEDGETILVESNDEGVIEFTRKGQGGFEIEMLEEEQTGVESSESGG